MIGNSYRNIIRLYKLQCSCECVQGIFLKKSYYENNTNQNLWCVDHFTMSPLGFRLQNIVAFEKHSRTERTNIVKFYFLTVKCMYKKTHKHVYLPFKLNYHHTVTEQRWSCIQRLKASKIHPVLCTADNTRCLFQETDTPSILRHGPVLSVMRAKIVSLEHCCIVFLN